MYEEKEWKRCPLVIDVKRDGLPMKGLQIFSQVIAVMDDKNILLGLVAIIINKQQKGKGADSTCGGSKANVEGPLIECLTIVRAHCQPITNFMSWQPFDARWGPSQPFEQIPLK